MVQSKAKTVEQYLKELPPERREVVAAVRKLVRKHLPKGYVESMAFGMIGWGIPLARYPNTYNGQPLGCVALAAQKNYYSLYLMCVYANSAEERALRAAFAKAGKRLDMGKSCVRFERLADLEMAAIGKAIAATPPERLIELYEESRKRTARGR
jgi:hypothetical protein